MWSKITIVLLVVTSSIAQELSEDIIISNVTQKLLNYPTLINNVIKSYPGLSKCVPTFKMLDASANVPSGILQGNLVDFGNFDECLSVYDYNKKTNETNFGKYCLVEISLPVNMLGPKQRKKRSIFQHSPEDNSTGIIFGWCIPQSCPLEDLSGAVSEILQEISTDVEVVPAMGGVCQTKNDTIQEFSVNDKIIIIFLSITLIIIIVSTIYDMFIQRVGIRPAHILFTAFSIKTNGQKLLATSKGSDDITCFHGLRLISMLCIINHHRYVTTFSGPLFNSKDLQQWIENPGSMRILNGGIYVDTFFVMGGLLVSYGFCLAQEKGIKFNITMFYIHRYLRLTPVYAVIVWFHATLLPFLGSGPLWPLSAILTNNCVNYWWPTLLYIQTFYNPGDMCMGHTWYLNVDMQLFILSPLLLIPLWKWPKPTMGVCMVLLSASVAIPFYTSYIYDVPALPVRNPRRKRDFLVHYYFQSYNRYGPWLMGFMLGYHLFKLRKCRNNKTNWHPFQVAFGWIMSLVLLGSVIYSGHGLIIHSNRLGNYFFNAFQHQGCALGVCWVIYACTQGYGGLINSFLSNSLFQILSRLNYTLYLTHLTTMELMMRTSRTGEYFTDFFSTYRFLADFSISLLMSVCLSLAYEFPMITIEKVLFKRGKTTVKSTDIPKDSGKIDKGLAFDVREAVSSNPAPENNN